jgi:hypothetical protein
MNGWVNVSPILFLLFMVVSIGLSVFSFVLGRKLGKARTHELLERTSKLLKLKEFISNSSAGDLQERDE